MSKNLISVLIAAAISVCTICTNAGFCSPYGTTKTAVITVPEGQVIHTIVTTPMSSRYLSLGQRVTMVLGEDFYYNKKLVVPMDSVVSGNVIKVVKAAEGRDGELWIRFTRITTPYGIQIPIAAVVKNEAKTDKIEASDEFSEAVSEDIVIPVNTPVDLLLIQPITVNPEIYNTN